MTSRRLVLLAAFALLVAACGREPPNEPAPGTILAENATEAPLLPRFADELPLMDPATFEELLAQLEGTPVVVNVWGSWCPPCHEEMPRLVAAHREFGDGVQFVGIDILDSRGEAKAFMEEFGMTFPSVFDPPDAIKPSLGQFGQPVTMFFRADGSLSFAWAGPIRGDLLRRNLRAIAG
jgi:cytochrome c biogenesis protein CcmG/thiol:disulfide interchange protein DsbE